MTQQNLRDLADTIEGIKSNPAKLQKLADTLRGAADAETPATESPATLTALTPATKANFISELLFGLEVAIKLVPGLITDIMGILGKSDPTAADWQALRDKVNAKGYFDYVTQSDLADTVANTPASQ